jgi:hypothetical protein
LSALPEDWETWPALAQLELLRELRRLYYWDRPSEWIREYIRFPDGKELTPYQIEIIDAVPVRKRVCVRGPHGLGKTTIAALIIIWFALTREGLDWKILTTASKWRQLKLFLWPEVHKWASYVDWDKLGHRPWSNSDLLVLGIKMPGGLAAALASDNPGAIEGAHADHLLYIFDESKEVNDGTFDAAEGAFSGAGDDTGREAYALAVSTPGEPSGRFHAIQTHRPGFEDWWVRHVTLAEAMAAGRITQDWVDKRKAQWGDSAVYQNRVEGNFASSDEDAVVPLTWVELANDRWNEINDAIANGTQTLPAFTCVGVDVARSGADRTVLALRHDHIITELRETALENTMQTTGRVSGLLNSLERKGYACVDVIGIGAGVVDRLREEGFDVEAFNASERSLELDFSGELGMYNRRSASWWRVRELLDPAHGPGIALPPDDMLTGDLTAPHWRVMSRGNILVEGKDEIKKRLGRSTDHGDAVVQAFATRLAPDEEYIEVYDAGYSISPL